MSYSDKLLETPVSQRDTIIELSEQLQAGIRSAGVTEICAVAPQLRPLEAENLLAGFEDRKRSAINFAGPPLLVHGAVRVYQLLRAPVAVAPVLTIAQVQRDSLATYLAKPAPVSRELAQPRLLPADQTWRAIDYSLSHWLPHLRWDNWHSVIAGFIFHAGLKATRWWASVKVDMGEFSTDEKARPLHNPVPAELDLVIQDFTCDQYIGKEIQGDRLPYAVFNCGRCGGGVVNYRCVFCDQGYGADTTSGIRQTKWPWPLPVKVANMFNFEIDPIEARKACYARWSRTKFRLDGPLVYKEQRPVDLD